MRSRSKETWFDSGEGCVTQFFLAEVVRNYAITFYRGKEHLEEECLQLNCNFVISKSWISSVSGSKGDRNLSLENPLLEKIIRFPKKMLKACPKLIVKPSWILCEIWVDFCV